MLEPLDGEKQCRQDAGDKGRRGEPAGAGQAEARIVVQRRDQTEGVKIIAEALQGLGKVKNGG